MPRGLVVTGGTVSITQLKDTYDQGIYDLVIGVDHGMDYLKEAGIVPDVLLGDFDSCSEVVLDCYREEGIKIIGYPSKKDLTDTHLAIEVAVEMQLDAITLMGATGSRIDHGLSNIFILGNYVGVIEIDILDEHNHMFVTDRDCVLDREDYTYISLLPLTPEASGVCFEGVKYPLKDARLKMMDSLGVSNEMVEEQAVLKIGSGTLLVVRSRD